MSNTVVARRNNNPVSIDKIGAYVNLLRKQDEPIVSYRQRVMRAYKDLYELDNESFWRSLGYLTDRQEKPICLIDVTLQDKKNCNISITNEAIKVDIEGTETIVNFVSSKFLIDLVQSLEAIEGLSVTMLQEDDSWKFLYSKNLIKQNTARLHLNVFVDNILNETPRTNVLDFTFWNSDEEAYPDDSGINRQEKSGKLGFIEYKDFPILATWTPFVAVPCNELEFQNLIKDTNGILTQKGAKIINKILEKQNTYWGE